LIFHTVKYNIVIKQMSDSNSSPTGAILHIVSQPKDVDYLGNLENAKTLDSDIVDNMYIDINNPSDKKSKKSHCGIC